MDNQHIAIPLKRFLLVQQCPADWKGLDLYLFRDETVAFYAGQSYLAFGRVWDHLLGGFKGHSIVGRFIWNNWPASMNFSIELLSSRSAQFDIVGNDLDAAERLLIERLSPCFNTSLNSTPTPVPASYLPPNAHPRRRRSFSALVHEAERAVKLDETRSWMKELE